MMLLDSNTLPKIATVLEKVADYVERVESSKVAQEQTQRAAAAHMLADKLAEATGERFDEQVIQKLANLDPEVAELLSKFAGEASGVESMGGPDERTTVKTASAQGKADSRFIEWVTGP